MKNVAILAAVLTVVSAGGALAAERGGERVVASSSRASDRLEQRAGRSSGELLLMMRPR